MKKKLRADFNGVFGDVLCLSHEDTSLDEAGNAPEWLTHKGSRWILRIDPKGFRWERPGEKA